MWPLKNNSLKLKEHNHIFVHAQDFDFWPVSCELEDARINIELSQIRLRRPQSTLALPQNFSESKISDIQFW